MADPLKVLHLPTEVGGNAYGLSKGERSLGFDSEVLVAFGSSYGFPADIQLYTGPSANRLIYWMRRANLVREFFKLRKAYDVFHFNFGTTLLDPHGTGTLSDLPYYGANSLKVFTYNGCDARQKYPTMHRTVCSACHQDDCYGGVCNDGKRDVLRAKRIEKVDLYADLIFALNPDLMWTLPKRTRFLPYTISSWDRLVRLKHTESSKVRIVHAPSNRACKGSDVVLQTMEKLIAEYGDRVEFVLIENKSNVEALHAIARADLLIDQLYIGWYGAVAVEAMKMGVPVMVYIQEEDLKFIPSQMADDCRKVFFQATIEALASSLRELVENPDRLRRASEYCLEYVHTWHDPKKVAKQVLRAYQEAMDTKNGHNYRWFA